MTAARIIAWLVDGGWRWLLGAVAAIAFGWFVWAVWNAGYETAEQKCDAVAAKAVVEKLKRELTTAGTLATSATRTAAELQARDLTAQEQLRDLNAEIERLRAAAAPGGPGQVGANPRGDRASGDRLLDDACGLTNRGLRVLDGR